MRSKMAKRESGAYPPGFFSELVQKKQWPPGFVSTAWGGMDKPANGKRNALAEIARHESSAANGTGFGGAPLRLLGATVNQRPGLINVWPLTKAVKSR